MSGAAKTQVERNVVERERSTGRRGGPNMPQVGLGRRESV